MRRGWPDGHWGCMAAKDLRSPGPQQTESSSGDTRRPYESRPARRRVLVAEDEFLVAVVLEEDLRAAGCEVVGPFANLAAAGEAARRETFDLAILDINLAGEMVY